MFCAGILPGTSSLGMQPGMPQFPSMHPGLMQASYSSTINSAHQIAKAIFTAVSMSPTIVDEVVFMHSFY
jgi:hypothetical protein